MASFIIKRFFYGFMVVVGVITLVFLLFTILPGDPARMMLGQRADQQAVDAIHKELGLDKPLVIQYFNHLNNLSFLSVHSTNEKKVTYLTKESEYVHAKRLVSFGETSLILKVPFFGKSYISKREVSVILAGAFPNTFLLATLSILVAMIIGITVGSVTAVINAAWFNRIVLVFTAFGMALPSFFAAIIMAWIFAFLLSDYTGLNMFGSLYEVDDYGNGEVLQLKNLILPVITLGIRPLAVITELTRTSLIEVFSQDYIRTARAKGLSGFRVVVVHALRNALNPVITSVSSWYASSLAGAVFIEYIFDWKGIGVVIVEALENYDLPVVMGSVLLIAIILIIINIFVDIVYGLLDPRVSVT
ncbi:MAG: ABC transporter permease [Bacteroidales bacterium]|nr:ABC transporter permease [Bacteroidales bacterium]